MLALTMADRKCGECTECCNTIGVADLGKPYNVKCEHQSNKCNIYDKRPLECKAWNCIWKELILLPQEVKYRPDQFGIIFTFENDEHDGKEVEWLTLYETKPDAFGIVEIDFENHSLRIIKVNPEVLNLVTMIINSPFGNILEGFRVCLFNQRIPTSFALDRSKYPDEGEEYGCRTFLKMGERPAPFNVAFNVAPQRGSKEPLVSSIKTNYRVSNKFMKVGD